MQGIIAQAAQATPSQTCHSICFENVNVNLCASYVPQDLHANLTLCMQDFKEPEP